MELILLALLAFVSTISGQTMVPQCRCNQLRVCVQQEEQAMQTCAMSSQCMALLGGNRNQVSSCLTQKMQRGDTMDSCMKMKVAHMTCTNSTNPMQVRSRPMTSQQPMTTTDRSAVGQYHTCVKNCMMGSGSGGSQQSTTMRRGNCMQQLGCELDMAMVDLEAIVVATQSCMMMTAPSSATMMTNQQQGSTMTSTSSPAMTGLHPQDCQCLMNAGVQITCNMMGSNQATMTQMNNRGRRSNF